MVRHGHVFSSSNGRSLPLEWTIFLRDKRKRYEKSSYLWQYNIPCNFRVSCFVTNKKTICPFMYGKDRLLYVR